MNFNPVLDSLHTYEAGKPVELIVREYGIKAEEVVKLGSNENPRGCALPVQKAVQEALGAMHFYPDDSMYALKESLSQHFGVQDDSIIIGAGSDQIIDLAIGAKCVAGDSLLMAGVTFAMYEIYGKAKGARIIRTPSKEHNLEDFLELCSQNNPAIVFLCTPNNPLGDALDSACVHDFLRRISPETLVVIDGAYQEYAAYKDTAKSIKPKDFIDRYPNVLYLGTFSKVYGLGGMRIGYGIAQTKIIQALHKLRPPFNVTSLSLVAATEALRQQQFVQDSLRDCSKEMRKYEAFCKEKGLVFIPSFANFITLNLDGVCKSTDLADWLLKKGLIVRNLASYHLNAVRITIGTESQNAKTLMFLGEFLSKIK